MAKGIAIILTFILLAASLTILSQYYVTSMTSTAVGVNLSTAPAEVQQAYNQSTRTTITSIGISHYVVLLVSITAVIVSLIVAVLMAQANRNKSKI